MSNLVPGDDGQAAAEGGGESAVAGWQCQLPELSHVEALRHAGPHGLVVRLHPGHNVIKHFKAGIYEFS